MKQLILISMVLILTASPLPAAQNSPFMFIPDGGNMAIYGRGGDYFVLRREKYLNAAMLGNIRKLSSGLRIVSPADDPAGFAVAENMKKIINEIRARSVNDEDMRNYLNYVESALKHDGDVIARIREIVVRASNGIYGPEDRELVQTEIDQLVSEINANAAFAGFNRKKVTPELTASSLGLMSVDVINNYDNSLGALDRAMERIIKLRTVAGTQGNVLELRVKGRSFYYLNLQQAESRIRDLDVAEGISDLMKNHTLLKIDYGVILYQK